MEKVGELVRSVQSFFEELVLGGGGKSLWCCNKER
jgi:hypothetical protein